MGRRSADVLATLQQRAARFVRETGAEMGIEVGDMGNGPTLALFAKREGVVLEPEMDPERTKVIACATVIEEMLPYLPQGMAYEVLDFGLHLRPPNLKDKLQAAIDASGDAFDHILLGYGLCSLAVIGLTARDCTLVLPRVDDCIAIFLGSRQAYSEQSHKEPGTYYLTKGWIEVADTPFDEYERMVERYGQERADRLMKTMLKHYTRLVYIDTGRSGRQGYVDYARKTADKFGLRFEEIRGSNELVLKLLSGPWDEDYLVVAPGKTITYLDFRTSSGCDGAGDTSPGQDRV